MNNSVYELTVTNSKAIESAIIQLDTITVLSGVNAAGKSTLARMLNLMVNMSANYTLLAKRMAWRQLRNVEYQVVQFRTRIAYIYNPFQLAEHIKPFTVSVDVLPFSEAVAALRRYVVDAFEEYRAISSENGDARRAFVTFLRGVGIGEELATNVQNVLSILDNKFQSALDRYNAAMQERSYDIYNFTKGSEVEWLVDADCVELKEGSDVVYQTRRNPTPPPRVNPTSKLKEIFGLKRSFYLASPWISVPNIKEDGSLTISGDEFEHQPTKQTVDIDDKLFEILGGDVDSKTNVAENDMHQLKQTTAEWEYRRDDGLSVAFHDCATGIKALSILYLLYKKKYLDSETLLIIDEPEVHLHPQWVVRYATILVKICKQLNVRMLLTSHSPDMVSAIKVVAEAEGLGGVNFYCAKQSEKNKYKYNYVPLGNSIEKIFALFGKSIDYVDEYGVHN